MSWAGWALLIGALLVAIALTGTLLRRLPLTAAMVYLALGWLLGPTVADVLRPDPGQHALLLERLSEGALLISLFAVGMQLGVPLRDRRWRLPLRLAFVSMACMVAMVAVVGVYWLDLPLGAALLLGAILAPTDPVLASGVPSEAGQRPDRLGFSLAGEGGLNDGAAFPLVVLGLAWLAAGQAPPDLLRWLALDLLWSTCAGALIGTVLGMATGRLVVHLRSRHGEAVGLNEFLGLGLVCMAYGLAQLSLASGFLAVFAAGMALQRVQQQPGLPPRLRLAQGAGSRRRGQVAATRSDQHADDMNDSVRSFNAQLEGLVELVMVLLVGAMLAYARPLPAVWWFVPLVLVGLRPLSVAVSLPGEGLSRPQRAMICWFGIRGIGSIYYLAFVLGRGLPAPVADVLVSLTLWTVATSIVVHGLSAQPLMRKYLGWRGGEPGP